MEHIINRVNERFKGKADLFERSAKRFYLTIDKKDIRETIRFLFCDLGARFSTASGIDAPGSMEILYHMSFDRHGGFLTVRTFADKPDPEIDSITGIVAGAEWIEKEMNELLGIKFTGNPRMKSFLLPDDWPDGQYPLRKDYMTGGD